jgi:hypothetical protein
MNTAITSQDTRFAKSSVQPNPHPLLDEEGRAGAGEIQVTIRD